MFGWFTKDSPPRIGPDFSPINSRKKAEAAVQRGELEQLFLLPPEFGGEPVPQNIVYVPRGLADVKAGIDRNVVAPLVSEGKVTQYAAIPEYRGKSFVPVAIKIIASEPTKFATEINIWGEALERG
jgi:hypothetical protein